MNLSCEGSGHKESICPEMSSATLALEDTRPMGSKCSSDHAAAKIDDCHNNDYVAEDIEIVWPPTRRKWTMW